MSSCWLGAPFRRRQKSVAPTCIPTGQGSPDCTCEKGQQRRGVAGSTQSGSGGAPQQLRGGDVGGRRDEHSRRSSGELSVHKTNAISSMPALQRKLVASLATPGEIRMAARAKATSNPVMAERYPLMDPATYPLRRSRSSDFAPIGVRGRVSPRPESRGFGQRGLGVEMPGRTAQ